MMDHEARPRTSLLDRLIKAVRPSVRAATMGSPDMAEPTMQATAMDHGQPGMMAGAPSMEAPAMDIPAMGAPSIEAPAMAESAMEAMESSAMESSAMGDPTPTDGPSMA